MRTGAKNAASLPWKPSVTPEIGSSIQAGLMLPTWRRFESMVEFCAVSLIPASEPS